jgi:hypothetical protein
LELLVMEVAVGLAALFEEAGGIQHHVAPAALETALVELLSLEPDPVSSSIPPTSQKAVRQQQVWSWRVNRTERIPFVADGLRISRTVRIPTHDREFVQRLLAMHADKTL